MKTRKILKFSKERVILLDKRAKQLINGGNVYKQEKASDFLNCSFMICKV
ncbi:hypothetical protein [Chryseobacterium gallinarum]|uniref:Uncharacterized protein n=1 Tax=Chryseobacterium gallinarum TaxID=1324352 RepID=A0ABX6KMM7_CHRGL|nr:hypothetical protein [Chryseobacterium gallinarum]QIY89840.1 hypothetical protein FOB44_03840 [Chryseobacterium gallinarum]